MHTVYSPIFSYLFFPVSPLKCCDVELFILRNASVIRASFSGSLSFMISSLTVGTICRERSYLSLSHGDRDSTTLKPGEALIEINHSFLVCSSPFFCLHYYSSSMKQCEISWPSCILYAQNITHKISLVWSDMKILLLIDSLIL
jgi:hypothetical protein